MNYTLAWLLLLQWNTRNTFPHQEIFNQHLINPNYILWEQKHLKTRKVSLCITNYHHPEDTWPIVQCLLMHDKINQHPMFSSDLDFSKYFFLSPALGTCCCGPDNVTNSVILSPADSLWLPISAAATKTAPNESQSPQFRLLTSQRHLQSQTKDEETQGANSIDHWFVKQPFSFRSCFGDMNDVCFIIHVFKISSNVCTGLNTGEQLWNYCLFL